MTGPPGGPSGVPLSPWTRRSLADLLADHGLTGVPEQPFPNDGWSGASLSALETGGQRFILKRTSWALDWIARSTRDHALREAVLAADPVPFPRPLSWAHLGAAADGNRAAILMPDLSRWLIPWDRPDHGSGAGAAIDDATLDRVLAAIAAIHAMPWDDLLEPGASADDPPGRPSWPWCPIRERIELTSRPSAERYRQGGLWIGQRFIDGWDAFDRLAPTRARDLVAGLAADTGPLLDAIGRLPATGLHGDLKLANLALLPDGTTGAIDWQMIARAPVALELGWFLVSNVAQVATGPDATLDRYRRALEAAGGAGLVGDWDAQRDLAILIGLLLRGWRKGLDAEAGVTLPTGVGAAADLAWWGSEAVAAAARRL